MACLFCFNVTNDGISIDGPSELATNARYIIAKYFWFDINEINSPERCACSNCWSKMEKFHEFYVMVESNYEHQIRDDLTKIVVDPELDCKTEIFIDEAVCIKTEFDSTLFCVNSNDELLPLQMKEEILISEDPFTHGTVSFAADQESASFVDSFLEIEKVTELKVKKTKSKSPKQTKANNETKLSSKEPKRDPYKRLKEVHANADGFECCICRKPYASFRGIQKHMHVHDPIESYIYECDLCGKKFSRKYILRRHVHYHETKEASKRVYDKSLDKRLGKTPCPICHKEITTKNLKTHYKWVHEKGKKYICTVCDKGFSASSGLSQHALTHVDFATSKVQCEVCGKWLKNKNILRKHNLAHSTSAMKCPHCSKISSNKHALHSHISIAHTVKKYQCNVCPKSFSRPIMLREHEATHSKSMLYDCPYCSLKFRNKSNMCTHIRGQHATEWFRDREKRRH